MWKRFWAMILVMTLVVTQIPMDSYASEVTPVEETGEVQTSGTAGDSGGITWTYGETSKKLTITGEDSFSGSESFSDAVRDIRTSVTEIVADNLTVTGSAASMFASFTNVTSIDLSDMDTSGVTNMSNMFASCSSLTSLNVSGFVTTDVTNMSNMFLNCRSLTSLDLSSFVTTNVISMYGMFVDCRALTNLNISSFSTPNVTDMSYMFGACNNLASLDVSNFITTNVMDMSYMFGNCNSLTSLDLSSFVTSNVTDMSYMFSECSSLKSININTSNFVTKNVTDMNCMFMSCSSLGSLDVSGFDTSNVTNMLCMFAGCSSLSSLDVSGFSTPNVTNMSAMFTSCSGLNNLDLSNFDMTNVTNVTDMLTDCSGLSTVSAPTIMAEGQFIHTPTTFVDVSGNDVMFMNESGERIEAITSAVAGQTLMKKIYGTFGDTNGVTWTFFNDVITVTGTDNFTQPVALAQATDAVDMNIRNAAKSIVVKNLTLSGNISHMFATFSNVTSISFENVDVSGVTYMGNVFSDCNKLQSLDLSGFKTSNVTSMANMFSNCNSLTSLDLSNFNTSSVTNMTSMFQNCNSLSSLNLGNFDLTKVEDTTDMLSGCSSLMTIIAPAVMADKSITLPFTILDESGNKVTELTSDAAGKTLEKTILITDLVLDKASAEIEKGETLQLTATIIPENAANQTLLWTTSNTSIATVSQTGLVTGVGTGEVTVIATTQDGSNIGASCTVTVVDGNIVTGRAGDTGRITWTYDNASKKLTISGEDSFSNGSSFSDAVSDIREEVLSIVVNNLKISGSAASMFSGFISVEYMDLSGLDTSSVTSMERMFYDCRQVQSLDLSNFDTSDVTTMYKMFGSCFALKELNLSNFNTSKVAEIEGMFERCELLKELDLSSFDLSNFEILQSCSGILYGCSSLNVIKTPTTMSEYRSITLPDTFIDENENEVTEISYSISGQTLYKMIKVSELVIEDAELEVGKTVQLKVKVLPEDAKNQAVIWTTDDSRVTVTEDGFATGIETGEVMIIVTAQDGSGVTASHTFTIEEYIRGTAGDDGGISWSWGKDSKKLFVTGEDSFSEGTVNFSEAVSDALANSGEDAAYVSSIVTNGLKVLGSAKGMFANFEQLESIDLNGFDTSEVTDMSYMFQNTGNNNYLEHLDLSNFDTSKVENMSHMFENVDVTSLDLSSFDTSNVTNMSYMFKGVWVTSLDLSNFDTSKVENMSYMFSECYYLVSLTISNLNTSKVTDMSYMFNSCQYLKNLDLSSFNTSSVMDMSYMFWGCQDLESINLSSFNTSNVTNMSYMFYYCINLTNLNLSNFDTSNVTTMAGMFSRCQALKSINLSSFNTLKVTDMFDMFSSCQNLTSLDLSSFELPDNGVNMSSMFKNCSNLESLNLSSFVIRGDSLATDMLTGCNSLSTINAPDSWTFITLPYTFVYEQGNEVTQINSACAGKTLTKKIFVTGIELNQTEAELELGETLQLTVTVEPSDASNPSVTWTSLDEKAATVTENGLVTAVGDGEVIITATAQDGSNLSASCTLTITPLPATAPVITSITSTNAVYGYAQGEASATVVIEESDGYTYTYQWYSNTENQNSGGTLITDAVFSVYTLPLGMNAGEYYYYCVVTATRTDNNQTAVSTSDAVAVSIEKKTLMETMVSLDSNGEYEYTGTAITPAVMVTDGLELTEGTDYELTGEVNQTAYGTYVLRVEGAGNYSGTVSVSWSIKDTTAPSGKIEIGTDYWNTFLNNITFNKFYKETQSVKITGEDGTDQSGVDGIYYVLSVAQIAETELETLEWTEYNGSFSINPDNEYIVYAKITDVAGNVTYLSSDGFVLDSTAPVIDGVIDGTTYCGETTFTVTETYLDKVTVNGEEVTATDGNYILSGDKTEYMIIATDKSGNSTTVTITINDDHSWTEATCTEAKTCSVCKEIEGEALGHSWSEEWSVDEENHWHICNNSNCTETADMNAHADGTDADYACDECGYICYIQELSLDKTEAELENGETLQLKVLVTPENAMNQNITWSSSNETIATVAQDGFVTAVGIGEVTITAEAQDGSGLSASCVINVVWENILESCIKYDFAGGEINGELEVSEIYKQQTVAEIGFKQPILAEIPTKAGFTFLGWKLTEGEGGTYDAQTGEITGNYGTDYTLTAQWEEIVIEPIEIQSGEVEMQAGVPYKLPEGEWIIEGDVMVYYGGNTVYVSESGTYRLTEQNSSEDEITTETETTTETEVTTETATKTEVTM